MLHREREPFRYDNKLNVWFKMNENVPFHTLLLIVIKVTLPGQMTQWFPAFPFDG